MPNTFIIFNPIANQGEAVEKLDQIKLEAGKYGEYDLAITKYHRHAIELAEKAVKDGYKKIIAVGGDGTVHQVVNGMLKASQENPPTLGVVPFGSGNDFSFNSKLNFDLVEAMKTAFSGTPTPIDIGEITDDKTGTQYFANACGMFIEAAINIQSRSKTIFKGFLMYLVAVFRAIINNFDSPAVDLIIDGQPSKNAFLMFSVCNGPREGGGFMVAPDAVNNDGSLDYMYVTPISRLQMILLLPKVIAGTHVSEDPVAVGRFKELSIQSEQTIPFHLDGELAADFELDVKSVTVKVLPDAISICK